MCFAFVTYETLYNYSAGVSAGRDFTAIQAIQLYAQGIFYGTMALGFVLSGYMLTRVSD
jgi:hypothetical protein